MQVFDFAQSSVCFPIAIHIVPLYFTIMRFLLSSFPLFLCEMMTNNIHSQVALHDKLNVFLLYCLPQRMIVLLIGNILHIFPNNMLILFTHWNLNLLLMSHGQHKTVTVA